MALLLRFGSVPIGGASVCALFGSALASTGIAPAINSGLSAVAGLISSL
ncbi:hypothetical protein ACFRAI_39620 [Streptomyces sp. NPDC056637]